jgi:hypothetical protein
MIIKWKYWELYNPKDYLGFVYKITNITNGRFYIGKKYFWYNKKKKLTKKQLAEWTGPGRKPTTEVIQVESDWKTYWGSSKELLADIKLIGEDNFECQILRLCKTKKQLTYFEMHYQCKYECLVSPKFTYNENILGRFFPKDLI